MVCRLPGSSVHRNSPWRGLPCPPPRIFLTLHLFHLLHWQVGSFPLGPSETIKLAKWCRSAGRSQGRPLEGQQCESGALKEVREPHRQLREVGPPKTPSAWALCCGLAEGSCSQDSGGRTGGQRDGERRGRALWVEGSLSKMQSC